ncbi:MAG: hypothetical protein Q8L78_03345 [Coxiellaceae bacterium]|nr:hypothetical protein [Coxiellaceae bacterium]
MKIITAPEFEQITADPSAYYKTPDDVVADHRLTKAQKIMLLKLWAFDAHQIEVAQEENMIGDASPLRQILLLLHALEEK